MDTLPSVRDRIIETSTRLFYHEGYQATGINRIIEEAAIAKSSLYQHFRSKDDLLIEYISISIKKWFDGLQKLTGDNKAPEKNLLMLFDYRKKIAIENDFKGCAFIRLAYELPNLQGKAAELIREHKKVVKLFISKQVAELRPEIDKERQTELTNMIYTLYEGCGIESSLQHSVKPIEITRTIVSKLIN